jgi:ATP-dependent exoDNAse (exonuclease V) beta subunit
MSGTDTRDKRDRDLAEGKGDGLSRTYLVEAGAGTGKTTVLVKRFLALLGAGTDIERIVAITFTEKAAGELKVKLREELERRVRGGEDALAGALLHIDRAVIGTIHSFCATLLRESPVEAGVDPGFAVADGLGRTLLVTRAWDAWLEEQLTGGLPPALAQARSLGFTLERARELADLLASNRDLIDHVPGPAPEGDSDRFADELGSEAADFLRLAREHCSNAEDSGYAAIAKFADAVSAASYLSGGARSAYVLRSLKPAPGKRQGNRTNWDADVLASLRARAEALAERQKELAAASSHNAAVALVDWLRGFVDRYEAEKVKAGVLDFDDLLLKARDLLRDSKEARERWKGAYSHILVDEFQDTDPLQCEVVFYLSEEKGPGADAWNDVRIEPGKLFIVGDPKQSIYRFRRADIEMYERAKAAAGDVLHLIENFRTRPAIVAEVNAAFEGVMTPPEDGRKYQPEYEPLAAFRGPDAAGPGLVFLTPSGGAPTGASVEEVRTEEARAVAAFLAEVRRTGSMSVWDRNAGAWRPAGLGDIAILFRRTAALPAYEDALAAYDVDFRVAGGRRFYARREVLELSAVLAAVDDPHNGVAVVGALRSPFLGVSDESILLHRLKAGTLNYLDGRRGVPEVDRAFALLAGLHRARSDSPVSKVIRRVLGVTRALELYLMKPDGEQRHANLEKVVELAEAMERTEPLSLGGFVRWLRDVSDLAPDEAESPLSEEGGDFVRMLTIHKAKGLEFPVTVLADLSAGDTKRDAMVVDREARRMEFRIGADARGLETSGYGDLSELEREQRRAERLRLLYVGMTRARDALIVPWFVKGGDDGAAGLLEHLAGARERAGEPVRSLADAGGRPVVVFDAGALDLGRPPKKPLRIDAERAGEIDPASTRAFVELQTWKARNAGLPERLHRPAEIRTPSGTEEEAPTRGQRPEARAGAASGLKFGSLVHDVMERMDFANPTGAGAVALALARTAGLDPSAAEQAADLVARALASPVMRRTVASPVVLREIPFCVVSGAETVEGRMDLVFEESGGLVVVDYKTDVLPAEGAAALVERYRAQAEAYADSLARAVGKPVKETVLLFLRGPIEVPVPHARRSTE